MHVLFIYKTCLLAAFLSTYVLFIHGTCPLPAFLSTHVLFIHGTCLLRRSRSSVTRLQTTPLARPRALYKPQPKQRPRRPQPLRRTKRQTPPPPPHRRTHAHTHARLYSCTSLFRRRTSSPGRKAGMPMYGQPSQRKASPRLQLPHEPTLPWTVKSSSARSSASSLSALSCCSAVERLPASSPAIFSASPHVQSLHARRRLPTRGMHSGAGGC